MDQLLDSVQWGMLATTASLMAGAGSIYFLFMRPVERRNQHQSLLLQKMKAVLPISMAASDLTTQILLIELGNAAATSEISRRVDELKRLLPSVPNAPEVTSALQALLADSDAWLAARAGGAFTNLSFEIMKRATASRERIDAYVANIGASLQRGS